VLFPCIPSDTLGYSRHKLFGKSSTPGYEKYLRIYARSGRNVGAHAFPNRLYDKLACRDLQQFTTRVRGSDFSRPLSDLHLYSDRTPSRLFIPVTDAADLDVYAESSLEILRQTMLSNRVSRQIVCSRILYSAAGA
jgi:hypothetical protein